MPRTFDTDEIVAIVKRLAQCAAPIEQMYSVCTLCQRSIVDRDRIDDHERDCPWLLAKEWAELYGEGRAPGPQETLAR